MLLLVLSILERRLPQHQVHQHTALLQRIRMLNSLNMVNNYTGIDFENGCVELLEHCGFKASKTSEEDRGVDIIASITTNENIKKYYIQCKYQNKTLSMSCLPCLSCLAYVYAPKKYSQGRSPLLYLLINLRISFIRGYTRQ